MDNLLKQFELLTKNIDSMSNQITNLIQQNDNLSQQIDNLSFVIYKLESENLKYNPIKSEKYNDGPIYLDYGVTGPKYICNL